MELDTIWQAFAETGDPSCYMLYRAMERKRRAQQTEKTDAPGKLPRAED